MHLGQMFVRNRPVRVRQAEFAMTFCTTFCWQYYGALRPGMSNYFESKNGALWLYFWVKHWGGTLQGQVSGTCDLKSCIYVRIHVKLKSWYATSCLSSFTLMLSEE